MARRQRLRFSWRAVVRNDMLEPSRTLQRHRLAEGLLDNNTYYRAYHLVECDRLITGTDEVLK